MPSVTRPPALVAQETPSWCFAAAEVMVRNYRGLPTMSQYDIARRITWSLAELDPAVQERWELAEALDASIGQHEDGGANLRSQIVQLVRTQWNAFDNMATGGRFVQSLTAKLVQTEIDNDRIFVVGTAIHYYVVYGYSDDGKVLDVRDPWPAGQGGLRTRITLEEFLMLPAHVAIFF
ncbi:hypothetical protein B5K05_23495 [Rhizobium phaseoli]|uniref:papain-like cysteine protease family protein n=1 Tax=Rhizobium phaseoli TaxID=396 RepID=UPI000496ABAB|nr:papain-like cysteine protease family protein [Rhizobium phaseoli]KKZ84087.1 hypothetical protein RPHASCH2410_PD04070 [Rhizobium phaseoli Ch24-10]RDJ05017.1 hypothetical protein B5K04_23430 [Rhizobium phaseoli]RDJ07260.1 hypothetical protein B5K05_23495 [Rhizobium phaseoli]